MKQIHLRPEQWEITKWRCSFVRRSGEGSRRVSHHRLADLSPCSPKAPGARRSSDRTLIAQFVVPKVGASLAAIAIIASGCSSPKPLVLHDSVGPARTAAPAAGGAGSLVVYSAWDRFDTLDAEHPKHTPYTVRSERDGTVAHVHNQTGTFGQDPISVSLPAGHYSLQARATNVGPVRIPVVIRSGQTTVVYLDGSTAPAEAWRAEADWLRQPNGLIVGWKDQDPNQ